MAVTQEQVVEYIKGISVLELSQLVKTLESELGVSAAAAMPMAMPMGGGAAAGAAAPPPAAAIGMAIAAADTPNFSSRALTRPFNSRTVMPSISFTNVSAVIAMIVTSPLLSL